ncbi:MAG: hypothetical protein QXM08_05005 [Thermofilaceae archaeon]
MSKGAIEAWDSRSSTVPWFFGRRLHRYLSQQPKGLSCAEEFQKALETGNVPLRSDVDEALLSRLPPRALH